MCVCKAKFSITVTEFGIIILTSDLQWENALWSMMVTLLGIIIFVSDEHSEKVSEPIEVTLFGIVIFLIYLIDNFYKCFRYF